MTVHVGELTSQVEVQAPAAGAAAPAPPPLQPGWDERDRHRRIAADEHREKCRVAGAGFDG